jgi:hypothetical protein
MAVSFDPAVQRYCYACFKEVHVKQLDDSDSENVDNVAPTEGSEDLRLKRGPPFRCSKCEVAVYCSPRCQQAHAKYHSESCVEASQFINLRKKIDKIDGYTWLRSEVGIGEFRKKLIGISREYYLIEDCMDF